ncbi:hypothetical protein AC790_13315 [Pantoea sp. RIT-PI-b]|uniref:hypothetical protein n=1 Tax=Pantoea sp. RIT-PI-b TaxID=1681195 RepID=UPI0006768AF4|nr:hypothetical protein [Pantoea sp. RIT-PI-b]KNC11544.1 hypothetical protein AC790_13315 [Pantoea sp. RIT-PI-b]
MSDEIETTQERLDFERWYLDHWKAVGGWAASHTPEDVAAMRGPDGDYIGGYITGCWMGWKARACSTKGGE